MGPDQEAVMKDLQTDINLQHLQNYRWDLLQESKTIRFDLAKTTYHDLARKVNRYTQSRVSC